MLVMVYQSLSFSAYLLFVRANVNLISSRTVWLCKHEDTNINTLLLFVFSPRLLTEAKQAEFIHQAKKLIQLEKYEDAVSHCTLLQYYTY